MFAQSRVLNLLYENFIVNQLGLPKFEKDFDILLSLGPKFLMLITYIVNNSQFFSEFVTLQLKNKFK